MSPPCPFCVLPRDRIVFDSELALAFRDGFPVSPGHTLIIPKRHVASFFEITDAERTDLMTLLAVARQHRFADSDHFGNLPSCEYGIPAALSGDGFPSRVTMACRNARRSEVDMCRSFVALDRAASAEMAIHLAEPAGWPEHVLRS